MHKKQRRNGEKMKKKKIICLFLTGLMTLSMVACGGQGNKEEIDGGESMDVSEPAGANESADAGESVDDETVTEDADNGIGGYKFGFFYLPESDGLSAQFHRALDFCAGLTNCEIEYYDMMTFSAEEINTAVETLASTGCDGIMMISGYSPSLYEYMNEQGVYYCGLTRSYTDEVAQVVDGSEYNCGFLDESSGNNYELGYMVTESVIEQGATKIAYLAADTGSEIADERVRGMEAAAADYNIEIVTSYRGSDYATGAADILSTRGTDIDGMVSDANGDAVIAAINSAGLADSILYGQINAPSASDTAEYLETGHLAATTSGNNTYVCQMYMQLFNAVSGADRLFNTDQKLIPMIPSFVVASSEEWNDANIYVGGDVPGLIPDDILALNSHYTPDTTVEEKEALMTQYTTPEFWNLENIVPRVKEYLGEE